MRFLRVLCPRYPVSQARRERSALYWLHGLRAMWSIGDRIRRRFGLTALCWFCPSVQVGYYWETPSATRNQDQQEGSKDRGYLSSVGLSQSQCHQGAKKLGIL